MIHTIKNSQDLCLVAGCLSPIASETEEIKLAQEDESVG
jgi:hypothetical protein